MSLRRIITALAGLSLAAVLFAAPARAGDDNDGSRPPDPDAGAPGDAPAPPPAPPAAETSSTVSNEQQYRNALAALSIDPAGPHTIEIAASFTVDDGTDPVYANTTESLTINGNGFTVDSAGGSDQRFLRFSEDPDLTVNDLTVQGFETPGSGGAITMGDGGITVDNSTFIGNTAGGDGGAIDSDEDATIVGSTFVGNESLDGDGGAIDTSNQDSAALATDSTFTGNSAAFEGGALSAEGLVRAEGSTFSENQSEEGAAVGAYGSVELVNSTVTDNTGEFDVIDGVGEDGSGDVTLIHVTIAGNTVVDDEGVIDSDEDGVLTTFGTTISGTQGAGTNCETGDFSSVVSSYTTSDDASCGFTGTGDVENASDPGLGALADNGGPTETMLPVDGSRLVDAIPEADCDAGVTDDQRDVARPQDGDLDGTLACDVGAVEVEGVVAPPPDTGPIDASPTFTG